jgi:hypothetical protein
MVFNQMQLCILEYIGWVIRYAYYMLEKLSVEYGNRLNVFLRLVVELLCFITDLLRGVSDKILKAC